MFDNEERSEHRDILPAKYRLTDYKRKSVGKTIFNQKSNERLHNNNYNDTTSNLDNADATTQAYSNFEEIEKSTITHPFKFFYTTGEPVMFQT